MFPPSLKEVGVQSFSFNENLKLVEFLSDSIKINDSCFDECKKISTIVFLDADKIVFENKAMLGIPDNTKIIVKKNCHISGDGLESCKSKIHYFESNSNVNDANKVENEKKEEVIENKKEKPTPEEILVELFNKPDFSIKNIKEYPPEEVFLTPEILEESIQKKPYEDFLPTISFHFNKPLKDIDYDQLQSLLGEESVIINVSSSPTILQIALLSIEDFENDFKNVFEIYINDFKERLNSPIGQSVLGNLASEPEIHTPEASFNDVDMKKVQKIVLQKLLKDKSMYNRKFQFLNEDLYKKMEDQIRKDLEINQYEMVIVNQSIFFNKYINEYEKKIKSQIPQEDIVEGFVYHGSNLNNHKKILNQSDHGFLGKGVYATNDPSLAIIYVNDYSILDVERKAQIYCCISVYNKSKMKVLYDNSYNGKPIDNDIKNNFGINTALTGSITNTNINAQEFVFPNKFQIIPLCSFTVMRNDHYILWKDDNVKPNDINYKFMQNLSKKEKINIYIKNNLSDALSVIQNKKYARLKLITNAGGPSKSGKTLIEKARLITHTKPVCLVFATSPTNMEWISKMENVLFTSDSNDFRKFAELKMNLKSALGFISQLKSKYEIYGYKFKISKNDLLNYPEGKQECNLA